MPAPPMPLPSIRPREGPAMWLPSKMSSPSYMATVDPWCIAC